MNIVSFSPEWHSSTLKWPQKPGTFLAKLPKGTIKGTAEDTLFRVRWDGKSWLVVRLTPAVNGYVATFVKLTCPVQWLDPRMVIDLKGNVL